MSINHSIVEIEIKNKASQGAFTTVQGAFTTVQGAFTTVQGAFTTVQGAFTTVQFTICCGFCQNYNKYDIFYAGNDIYNFENIRKL